MKLLLVLCLSFIQLVGIAHSKVLGESEDSMDQKNVTTPKLINEKVMATVYNPQIAFESYTPVEHDDYIYQGVNIGFQYKYQIKDSQLVMIMNPNISFLVDEYKGDEEKMTLLKWDQGVAYNFEVGKNMLLQPLAQVGLGYGWLDAEKDQKSPLIEILAGANFVPSNRINIYAKAGYRFFDLTDIGNESSGDLKGGLALVGMGFRI